MNRSEFFNQFGKSFYHIDGMYTEYAKNCGITPTLLWILYAINDDDTHTQCQICYDWSLPKSTVNTLITELKNSGLIELEPIKGKRREMSIVLTESGKEYANRVLSPLYTLENEIYKQLDFDPKEFVKNLRSLEKVCYKTFDDK